ncbi:hypothetical protein [Marinoscillum sp. MHG1-6]|uniref:hypothetical protein n=1 Tax=Marinoscillum sp. MHG1-6 TaxID=2959627 RepID=UPI0021570989|nr:hypothetical protein [Marinoscillum sp. MHG1-6]
MVNHLSQFLCGKFEGKLIQSGSEEVLSTDILVESLNDLLVKVSFNLDGEKVVFRAMLTAKAENILMTVQQRVTRGYILDGKSGFLYGESNTHGGFLKEMDSFFFHVKMAFFDGENKEVYFLGKDQRLINTNQLKMKRVEQMV